MVENNGSEGGRAWESRGGCFKTHRRPYHWRVRLSASGWSPRTCVSGTFLDVAESAAWATAGAGCCAQWWGGVGGGLGEQESKPLRAPVESP